MFICYWIYYIYLLAPWAARWTKSHAVIGYPSGQDGASSVKKAGYWPRSFSVCLWTLTSSGSVNTPKKNEANLSNHLDLTRPSLETKSAFAEILGLHLYAWPGHVKEIKQNERNILKHQWYKESSLERNVLPVGGCLSCRLAIWITSHGEIFSIVVSLFCASMSQRSFPCDLLSICCGFAGHLSIQRHWRNSMNFAILVMFL